MPLKPKNLTKCTGNVLIDAFRNVKNSPLLWAEDKRFQVMDFGSRIQSLFQFATSTKISSDEPKRIIGDWLKNGSGDLDRERCLAGLEAIAMLWVVGNSELGGNLNSDRNSDLPTDGIEPFKILASEIEASVEFIVDDRQVTDRPLAGQILGVELPLTIAWVANKCAGNSQQSAKLIEQTKSSLTMILNTLLCDAGCLAGAFANDWRLLLASWIRCAMISKSLQLKLFDGEGLLRLQEFIRQTFRVLGPDKRLLCVGTCNKLDANWNKSFVNSIIAVADEEDVQILAGRLLKNKVNQNEFVDARPSSLSETAQICALRHEWDRESMMLGLQFDRGRYGFDLARKVRLIGGRGLPKITIDGQPINKPDPATEWEVTCWHSDDRVDFIELQMQLSGNVKLQRHVLMSYDDRFVMLGDVVLLDQPANIAYQNSWVLPGSSVALAETDNQEIYLRHNNKFQALIIPLSLPEWVGDKSNSLRVNSEGNIELRQSTIGQALYVPLWIDLNSERSVQPRTWRQLSVGDSLSLVPKDVAAAFRVQVGIEQWVLYRAIREKANRTFLGENHLCELFIGRFQKNGAEEILVIE